jgi:hypothetical protein
MLRKHQQVRGVLRAATCTFDCRKYCVLRQAHFHSIALTATVATNAQSTLCAALL